MLSIDAYRLMHIAGIMLVYMSLGAVLLHSLSGGDRNNNVARSIVAASHGAGVTLILLAGFGMLARLGVHWPFPLWVWVKVIIWVLIALSLTAAYRLANKAKLLWWSYLVVGIIGGFLGLYKPL